MRKEDVVDQGLVQLILEHFLAPVSSGKYDNEGELLKVGILHLSGVLVQYCPNLLSTGRKDIVKTGWNFVNNSDDLVVKQCANILLCRFCDPFEGSATFIWGPWKSHSFAAHRGQDVDEASARYSYPDVAQAPLIADESFNWG